METLKKFKQLELNTYEVFGGQNRVFRYTQYSETIADTWADENGDYKLDPGETISYHPYF